MAEETGDGADEARMERIVEKVLERQLPSIVARLAASGAATATAETMRSLPSEGGSKLSISLKSTGTRDELSITLYLQSEINFCSVRMPVNA